VPSYYDRAAATTTAVLQLILSSSPPAAARGPIEDLLRNQFVEVQREALAADRRIDPDA
jgi:hypothetical protein